MQHRQDNAITSTIGYRKQFQTGNIKLCSLDYQKMKSLYRYGLFLLPLSIYFYKGELHPNETAFHETVIKI